MKQAASYPGLEIDGDVAVGSRGRYDRARASRARNVKAIFGLWLGLFSFTIAWAAADLWQTGGAMAGQGVWLQLVVLAASVLFYLSARPVCEGGARLRLCMAPVFVSLVACALAVGSVLAHSGPAGFVPRPDPAFWHAVREAHFGNAFPPKAVAPDKTAREKLSAGEQIPAPAHPLGDPIDRS